MINRKKGSTLVVNLISVLVTIIIIIAIGVIYYFVFAPSKLVLAKIEYNKLDRKQYTVDKEFEEGLDNTIDIRYTDEELDMHRDLKDYYQGREDPFTQSDDRNEVLNLDGELENKISNSRPDLLPTEDEEEIDINDSKVKTSNSKSILNF